VTSPASESPETRPRASAGNGRLILLLIAGIPVTMILASTWLWFFVVKGDIDIVGALGTANQGTLVQPPRNLAQVTSGVGGMPLDFPVEDPDWTLLVPQAGDACDALCEERLYLTRQIHIAMGKEMARIRRVFVSDVPLQDVALTVPALSDGKPAPGDFGDYLGTEHPGLTAITLTPASFRTLFAELGAAPDTWYLVDPAGWIMMSYTPEISYKDVISDLKFLLKNSNG
jgi:hypothetical protein